MIPAAFWLASRACHRVLTRQPIIELELGNPARVFDTARHAVSAAIAAIDTAEPHDERRIVNLLVGAMACSRAGELPPKWLSVVTALTGTRWPERLPPGARLLVSQRWHAIERVAAELLYERRVAVSRVMDLCGVRTPI